MKTTRPKTRKIERKAEILVNRILIGMYSEGFGFTIFCAGFIWPAIFMAKYVFVKNSLEYFDFMLIVCPLLHYFIYGCRNKNKIKNEKCGVSLPRRLGSWRQVKKKTVEFHEPWFYPKKKLYFLIIAFLSPIARQYKKAIIKYWMKATARILYQG